MEMLSYSDVVKVGRPFDGMLLPVSDEVASGKKPFFTQEEREHLLKASIPRHVAIIPDGNRRWARALSLPMNVGYARGAYSLIETALAAKELGVRWITMYSFSTENWRRPPYEIALVMSLIEQYLLFYEQAMQQAGITVEVIGNIDPVPQGLREAIERVTTSTLRTPRQCTLVLAINYGGRDEIIRSFKKLLATHSRKELLRSLTEDLLTGVLDTASSPDPELIIRASGESRLSNFLLWQSSYSEVYIEPAAWPDYSPQLLLKALIHYQGRKRRMGGESFQGLDR